MDGNYQKFYLKPNFNFHIHRNFKINTAPQIAFMKYNNMNDNYPTHIQNLLELNSLRKNTFYLFEPVTFFQIGFDKVKWLKLDVGMVTSLYFSFDQDRPIYLRTRRVQFSAGFSIYP